MTTNRFTFLGAAALLLFLMPARAQDNPDKPAPPPAVNNWTINCGSTTDVNKLECQMSTTLTEQKTGQRVLTVSIRTGPDSVYGMVFMLPHGIYIPAGATYQIDQGEKTTVPVQTADQNGSYASLPLTDALINALKRGTALNIGMETANRAPVALPVSLTGFAVTYDKLVKMD
jgi:invasion protein IalB